MLNTAAKYSNKRTAERVKLLSRTVQPSVNTPHSDSCGRFGTKPVLRGSDSGPTPSPSALSSSAWEWSAKSPQNAVEG